MWSVWLTDWGREQAEEQKEILFHNFRTNNNTQSVPVVGWKRRAKIMKFNDVALLVQLHIDKLGKQEIDPA